MRSVLFKFSASEMTYIVSSGALNSTHSLTPAFHCSGASFELTPESKGQK